MISSARSSLNTYSLENESSCSIGCCTCNNSRRSSTMHRIGEEEGSCCTAAQRPLEQTPNTTFWRDCTVVRFRERKFFVRLFFSQQPSFHRCNGHFHSRIV